MDFSLSFSFDVVTVQLSMFSASWSPSVLGGAWFLSSMFTQQLLALSNQHSAPLCSASLLLSLGSV